VDVNGTRPGGEEVKEQIKKYFPCREISYYGRKLLLSIK
jgi:hypothetical protein